MPEVQSGQGQAAPSQHLGVLPAGTMLHTFEIVSVLGHGGFGVTYLARDTKLHRDVAIKEYLPTALALRHDGMSVLPRSTDLGEDFVWGRDRFLDEARILAKLENAPAVVRVIDFLEANGTAYMVMALVKGETLEQRLRRTGTMDAGAIQRLLPPLVGGLRQVHEAGFLHRDIKPANVLLDEAGNPTLIDFGASRAAMANRTTAMTAIFTPGYAAAEQFTSGKQGPWTDIYGLCATLYHAILGKTPPSAFERVLDDAYEPLSQVQPAGFPSDLLAAIDKGLAVRAGERPQTVDDWYALVDGKPVPDRTGESAVDPNATVLLARPKPATPPTAPKRRAGLWSAVAAIVLLIGGGGAYIATRPASPDPAAAAAAAAAQKARDELAANEAARRKAEEDLAKLRAETAAREKEAADAAQRKQIEEETRRKIAAEEAEAAAAKQKADDEAKQKAEAEAAAKRAAEEADKKSAEAAETALRLSSLDRQHLQIALTAAGFNTNGSDGAFGPHSRDMIAAWQRAHGQAATGFLTSAQEQTLLKDGAAAIKKYDDDQKAPEAGAPRAATAAAAPDDKAKPATATATPTFANKVEADPTGRNLTVTVKSGVEIRVNLHGHRDDCVQLSVPVVELINHPANGQAAARTVQTHVNGCTEVIEQTGVYYRSKPGYVGPDSFTYERKPNNGTAGKRNRYDSSAGVYRVTIDVRP